MHHVGVALDHHFFRDFHAAGFTDSAHIIAPQIDQHEVLGNLFWIGEHFIFHAWSFSGVSPRLRVPAIGRTVT